IIEAKLTPRRDKGRNLLGFVALPEQSPPVVARVLEKSPAAELGIPSGATLRKVNDAAVDSWPEVYDALKAAGEEPVTLTYTLHGTEKTAELGTLTKKVFDPDEFAIILPAVSLGKEDIAPLRRLVHLTNPIDALARGVEDTRQWLFRTYKSLLRIIQRRVGTEGTVGPVGIGQAAVTIAKRDGMEFVHFMSMLSAMIAVFNFLPLPVLDGGHAVLVIVEKLIRRPIPMKVQYGIQIAGWVLILGLFLALTFRDIMRIVSQP
ncbi:hypothetical protein LCGC14_2728430, partial [marine sediment metagenome]